MTALNLTVEVNCHRPAWSINKNYPTAYRIYNNNDLLTERTWMWNNNTVIRENIWLYTDTNVSNVLTITPVVNIQEQAAFNLNNFTVLNHSVSAEQINEHTISFILQ
jgi:hypothetical protein